MSEVRRRFSFTCSSDVKVDRSSLLNLRVSGDSCSTESNFDMAELLPGVEKGNVTTFESRKRSNSGSSGQELSIQSKKTITELKSILKKQSSLDKPSYASLVALLSSDKSLCSEDKGDFCGMTRLFPVPSRRRVRFCEQISVQASDEEEQRLSLEEFGTDEQASCNCVQLDALGIFQENKTFRKMSRRENSKLPDRLKKTHERTKLRRDLSNETITKRTMVSSSQNGNSCHTLATKTAWSKPGSCSTNDDSVLNRPVVRKEKKYVRQHSRSLDRAKTDLGSISYKDVQSKLRRMGFFDSRCSLKGRNSKLSVDNSVNKHGNETPTDELKDKQMINDRRLNCRYTTVREELYDITDSNIINNIVSGNYPTEGDLETDTHTLGDEYARFLRGRYKGQADDVVQCS